MISKSKINFIFFLIFSIFITGCGSGGGGGSSTQTNPDTNSVPSAKNISITDENGGDIEIGDVLKGNYEYADDENDKEGESTFKWFREGVEIVGAVSSTYIVVTADSGKTITFEVIPVASTGSKSGNNVVSTGMVTSGVSNDVPTASSLTITDNNGGSAIAGDILTGAYIFADVDGDPEGTSTIQWLRNGVVINNATSLNYTVLISDGNSSITFEVTPIALTGETTGSKATSSSITITVIINTPPTATNVTIVDENGGTVELGDTLKGSYTYSDANGDAESGSEYRWLRNNFPISGANSINFTLTSSDIDKSITFEVSPKTVTGDPKGSAVVSSGITIGSSINNPPVASLVTITDDNGGTAEVGDQLTGSYLYSDSEGDIEGSSTFRWLRNGTAISGAISKTYTLGSLDSGKSIAIEVTPIAATGTTTGNSSTSSNITVGGSSNTKPIASSVNISDVNGETVKVGDVLTGNYSYSDTDGDLEGKSTFRWLRDDTAIANEMAIIYTLTSADTNKNIKFEVTPHALNGELTGHPTASDSVKIGDTINKPPTASGISIVDDNGGNIEVGDNLTGSYTYSDIENDLEGTTLFRWLSDGIAISGATSSTYLLVSADSGKDITFEVTPIGLTGGLAGSSVISSVLSGTWILNAPQNVTAKTKDKENEITWDSISGATSYKIYWSTTAGVTTSSTAITGVSSPYSHTGLTNGTKIYYIVTALFGTTESLSSSEVSGTPFNMPTFKLSKWKTFSIGSLSSSLAGNLVLSMSNDDNGNMWFGTEDGLNKFDGTNWTTFRKKFGLAGNYVYAVFKDHNGVMWFGTNGGISKYDGNTWEKYDTNNGLISNTVLSIFQDSNNNMWFGTNSGINKFDGVNWTEYTDSDGLAHNIVNSIAQDNNGNMWFATEYAGASKFDGTNWTTYNRLNGLVHEGVKSVLKDSAGALWFATVEGASKFDGSTWTTYFKDQFFSSLFLDSENSIWIGPNKFDGTTWTTYTTNDGLINDKVHSVAEDSAGAIWFGTLKGLSKFNNGIWASYLPTNSIQNNEINSIMEDRSGVIWFGTEKGASKLDGTNWTNYTSSDGLVDNRIRSVVQDLSDNIWFGTANGASNYDGSNWTNYTTNEGLYKNLIISLYSDSTDSIWFGGHYGVTKFDGTNWITYKYSDGLSSNDVYSIYEDKNNNMWFGTYYGGVSKFDGTNWTTYNNTDGLSGNHVYSIYEDKNNNMWFGTRLDGVSKFDGTNWTTYKTFNGLAHNTVFAILEGNNNDLWFATEGGASKFDGTTWESYTTSNSEIIDNNLTSMIKDSTGAIWFGSKKNGASKLIKDFFIDWVDTNTLTGYTLSFYYDTDLSGYDGILITSGINETDTSNTFSWNTSSVSNGTYYVYLVFTNGVNTEKSYLTTPIIVD
ncbi:MAG: hypothetical protein COA79_20855 [Planctomycetota bacterium]|nr:MAG: hypothetical protein COA79_20855 [Planctomycetota bacterium]